MRDWVPQPPERLGNASELSQRDEEAAVFATSPAIHWLSVSLGASPQDVQEENTLGQSMQMPRACTFVQKQFQDGGCGPGASRDTSAVICALQLCLTS